MDALDRYELLTEPDVRGYVTAIRMSDNRRAPVKLAWLKRVSEISDVWMPRSRTKAIRLAYFCDWQ